MPLSLLCACCAQSGAFPIPSLKKENPHEVGYVITTGCSKKEIGYSKLNKTMLRFSQKRKHSRITGKILKVLSNAEERALPDTKMYFETRPSKFGACEGKGWQLRGRLSQKKFQTNKWVFLI